MEGTRIGISRDCWRDMWAESRFVGVADDGAESGRNTT